MNGQRRQGKGQILSKKTSVSTTDQSAEGTYIEEELEKKLKIGTWYKIDSTLSILKAPSYTLCYRF